MSKEPTFGDLVKFVLENKTNKTFIGYPLSKIEMMLLNCMEAGTLLYSLDSDKNITGMILAQDYPEDKILYVEENLAMNLSTLRKFAAEAKVRWPDHKLKWIKHSNEKEHDSSKVYHKLKV